MTSVMIAALNGILDGRYEPDFMAAYEARINAITRMDWEAGNL